MLIPARFSHKPIDARKAISYRPHRCSMNAKLLLKTIFLMIVLLLLVIMGMHNQQMVRFALPPLLPHSVTQPAAIMYFGFFAVGVLTGTVLTAGGGKKGGGSSSTRSSKPGK
jgi:uncharacterized integral membrane protein